MLIETLPSSSCAPTCSTIHLTTELTESTTDETTRNEGILLFKNIQYRYNNVMNEKCLLN